MGWGSRGGRGGLRGDYGGMEGDGDGMEGDGMEGELWILWFDVSEWEGVRSMA